MITFILFYFRGPHRIPLSSEVSLLYKDCCYLLLLLLLLLLLSLLLLLLSLLSLLLLLCIHDI